MSPDEITAAAVEYIGHDGPIVAFTLARWAAYPDPVELPAGWRDVGGYATDTGLRQMAQDPRGRLFTDAPRRLIPWTCPAGVTHRRYWRSVHHPNRPALVACEHQPEPAPLHP